MTRRLKTRIWDAAEHLKTDADVARYLDAALAEGDPSLIVAVLGDIARARGMTQLARDTGLGRTSLYKALSPTGSPEFATIMKVVNALGLRLAAARSANNSQLRVAEPRAVYEVSQRRRT